jgi:AcrR family transcriptional regulator
MSPRPFDHLASAHRRLADAHRAVREKVTRSGSSPEIRGKLVDAADRLLGERPVSAITTRDIARAAGLSDGVLYNYFADKHDLVVAALVKRVDAQLAAFRAALPKPGEGGVEEGLVAYAQATLDVATAMMPTIVGLMSEPDLLHRFLAEIHDKEYGIHREYERIVAYLEAEQGLGRLGEFDVEAAVTALVGSMVALGVGGMVTGRDEAASRERVRGVVRTLIGGIGTQSGGQ